MPPKKTKQKPVAVASAAEQLSEYEQIRLAHIKRNQEFMEQLGLFSVKQSLSDAATQAKPVPHKSPLAKPPPMPEELRRRSARIKRDQPQYTGEAIDRFGESLDNLSESVLGKRNREVIGDVGDGDADDEIDYNALKDEMREAAMKHMEQVRLAMLPTAIADESTADPNEWREEAVRRWGVAAGATPRDDWKKYVQSRLSTPPPVSPLDFLQEYYAADTWRLLVACILMSRVSSWETKHNCISAFFALYPTPTAFLQETGWSRVKNEINSLGLFDDRLKSLISLTTRFIEADEFEVDPDPKSEHKIRGVGAFGHESYLVFCRDAGATICLSAGGKPIAPFVAWRKRMATTRV
ncbi:unnamed protein product [Ectocarpus fasciculatus]